MNCMQIVRIDRNYLSGVITLVLLKLIYLRRILMSALNNNHLLRPPSASPSAGAHSNVSQNFPMQREEIIDVNSAVFKLQNQMPTFKTRQETYVPRADAVNLLRKLEEDVKARIQQYKDYAMQLRDRYRVFEHEAATHYEKIAEDMRSRVKKQIKEQEDVHNKLKWDIEQNNILITFLNGRLEEAEKRIQEKDNDLKFTKETHVRNVENLKRQTEEQRLQDIADAKARQVEASVDCPLDRVYVAELLDKLEQAKKQFDQLESEKQLSEKTSNEKIEEIMANAKQLEEELDAIRNRPKTPEPEMVDESIIEQQESLIGKPPTPRSPSPVVVEQQITRQDTPVDMDTFIKVREQKRQNKQLLQFWYSQFERKHLRKPQNGDAMSEVRGLMENRRTLVTDYTVMKAKLFKASKQPIESIKDLSPRIAPTQIIQSNLPKQLVNLSQVSHQLGTNNTRASLPTTSQVQPTIQTGMPITQQQQVLLQQIQQQNATQSLLPLPNQQQQQIDGAPLNQPIPQGIQDQSLPNQVITQLQQVRPQDTVSQNQSALSGGNLAQSRAPSVAIGGYQTQTAVPLDYAQQNMSVIDQNQSIISQQPGMLLDQSQDPALTSMVQTIQQHPSTASAAAIQQQQMLYEQLVAAQQTQQPPQVIIQQIPYEKPPMTDRGTAMTPKVEKLSRIEGQRQEVELNQKLASQHDVSMQMGPPLISNRDQAVSPLDKTLIAPPQQQPVVIQQTSEDDRMLIESLRKEISQRQQENKKLEGEIARVNKMLTGSYSQKEVVKNLNLEIERQKQLLVARDNKVRELMHAEEISREHKEQIIKDLEVIKNERDKNAQEVLKIQNKLHEQTETIAKQQSEIVNLQKQKPDIKIVEKIVVQQAPPQIITQTASQQPTQAVLQQPAPQLSQPQQQLSTQSAQPAPQVQTVVKTETQYVTVVDTEALKLLQDELNVIKEQNGDLLQQIDYLKKFHDEQRANSEHIISGLQSQNKAQVEEIGQMQQTIKSKLDEIAMLKIGMASDHNALQNQLAEAQSKISEKEIKIHQQQEENAHLTATMKEEIVQREKFLQQKQVEIEQLKTNFKKQEAILREEIKSQQQDLEKLQKSKEGALAEVNAQFQKQLNQLEAKQKADLAAKEQELQRCQTRIAELERQSQALQDEIESLKKELTDKAKEAANLVGKIKELEVAVSDGMKVKEEAAQLKAENAQVKADNEILQLKFKEEQKKRKDLHNQLEDMKGTIRLFCRIRPLSKTELEREESKISIISVHDEFTVRVNGKSKAEYTFDSVFGPDSTQDQVFEETRRLVQSAIDGYNVCIFAYGQTGSGKTYTIQGSPENPGITPKAIDELFDTIQSMTNFKTELFCYMVELYKTDLRDLLLPKGTVQAKLEIKENPALQGMVYIPFVTEKQITTVHEAINIFRFGLEHRQTRATKMNDSSSRSHLIFSIIVRCQNKQTGLRTVGKLSFVDLAGSERGGKTGNDKEGAAEGRAINQSLSALGNVISALSKGLDHIPYRDHPLTLLMKDSLGGTAKTLMFVNVSPSNYNESESKNSMDYATRVKKIKNKIQKNVESNATSSLKKLVQDQDSLIAKLKEIVSKSNLAGELEALESMLALVGVVDTHHSSQRDEGLGAGEIDDEYDKE